MKKKIIVFVAFLLGMFCANAQHQFKVLDSLQDGTVKFANILSQVKSVSPDDSKSFLKSVLKVEKGIDFYLLDTQTDDLGMTHEKYQQTYNGITVAFREYIVHKDKDGNIVTVNGDYGRLPENIQQIPILSFKSAIEKGIKKHSLKNVIVHQLEKRKSVEKFTTQGTDNYEIVFVTGDDNQWHLAYKVNITPGNITDNMNAYFSCETGDIVFVQPLVHNTNVTGTAATRYSGTRTITTDSYNGKFRLRETSRSGSSTAIQTFNFNRNPANSDVRQTGIANATDFTDNNNNWTSNEYDNTNLDNVSLDVHWGTEMAVDYFRKVHGRNSYDNNNSTVKSYVHARFRNENNVIVEWDNALWDGSLNVLIFGDGNVSPLTSLDIVAHEFAHGVCKYTANLVYSNESGAINEGLSDIWGACVENWATTGKQTWSIGEDLGFAFRSMSNPNSLGDPDTYSGTFWVNPVSSSGDNGGVHTNSGVINHWFYLLSQGGSGTNDLGNTYNIVGIGIEKAAKIVYRAECYYMSSNTNYAGARTATIQAAKDYYNSNSQEDIEVTNAWYAVGVGVHYPLHISGVDFLCPNSNATYTILNKPSNATITWTYSGVSLNSTNNTTSNSAVFHYNQVSSTYLYATGTYYPPIDYYNAWIEAKLNLNNGTSVTLPRKYIREKGLIKGIYQQYPAEKRTFSTSNLYSTPDYRNISIALFSDPSITYSWTIENYTKKVTSNNPDLSVSDNGRYVNFSHSYDNSYRLTVSTVYCGASHSSIHTFTPVVSGGSGSGGGGGCMFSYRPGDGTLEVSFETAVLQQTYSTAAISKTKLSYAVQLYNITGSLVKEGRTSGETVIWDLSSLPDGVYILSVKDGNNEIYNKKFLKN